MGKIRKLILKYLDQMICVGGSVVIICVTLKFIEAPGADIIFCFSLIVEAFIFLLGAIKPGENFHGDHLSSSQPSEEDYIKTEEVDDDEKAFFIGIQEEIRKINEKINKKINKQAQNKEENARIDTTDLLKKINLLSTQVNILFCQTKKIEEDFSLLKKEEKIAVPTEENKNKITPVLNKRGRPKKNKN